MQKLTRWNRIGAACLALGGLLYLLAERISALAWQHPPYRYQFNYISDLGIPQCGSLICSPLHNVMNSGFAAEGVLFFCGCVLLFPLIKNRWALLLAGIHGAGGVLIALFHSGGIASGITLHQTGAVMAIGGGNLCLIAVGAWCLVNKRFQPFGYFSLLLGGFGLLSMLAIPSALFPIGIIERASVYPITSWQIVTGFALLIKRSGAD
ncbi:DUF998 domain-containing protein [Erwinia aphidicola]|uniref:DUF998 domain-containing protein n=1 Tax=Erwinia aphidicola TaxID=68334 RepID=UPI00209D1CB4|nr:DUF998 domain-containing protein [Erwinia aphidicola]MCP2233938.1 putative membrane protein [Erwinia aphidicola]